MSDSQEAVGQSLPPPNNGGKVAEIKGRPIDVEEIADVIWLAHHIWQSLPVEQTNIEPDTAPPPSNMPATDQDSIENDSGGTDDNNSGEKFEDDDPLVDPSIPDTPEDQQTSTTIEHSAAIGLDSGATQDEDSTPFFVPTASALPQKLDLARSLRPLKRTVPSPTQNEIDEILSAEKSAETNTPTIVLKPKRRRWLDIAIVIDEAPSMAMWHRTIAEFITMLEQMGAFRNIFTYGLALERAENDTTPPNLRLHTTTGAGRRDGRTCDKRELIDLRGERVTLIISDTSSSAWYASDVLEYIDFWSLYGPVSILHMLPRSMWEQTTLVNELDVKLNSNIPCVPNSKIRVAEWPWYWFDDEDEAEENEEKTKTQNPIPVITLEPYSMAPWANLIAGRVQSLTFGYIFLPELEADSDEEGASNSTNNTLKKFYSLTKPQITLPQNQAQILFDRHWQTLSKQARELAAYLATGPINLEIIRIVQQQIMGDTAQQSHVAELMYSGLFCQLSPPDSMQSPDEIVYDFYGGEEVRRCWRETTLRSKTVDVFHQITNYIDANAGRGTGFKALLYNQELDANTQLTPLEMAFAEIAPEVLHDMGGFYAEWAKQLESTIWTTITSDGNIRTTSTTLSPEEGIQEQQRVVKEATTHFNGYALIIGMSKYQNLPDMGGTENGIRFLADILKDPQIAGYKRENLKILEGTTATHANIVEGLRWLSKKLVNNWGSTGLICYSGTGNFSSDEDEYYLIPYEARYYSKEKRLEGGLSGKEIASILSATPFQRLVIAIDCSYAAGIGESIHTALSAIESSRVQAQYAIWCAAAATEHAYMRQDNLLGSFTNALLSALYGSARELDMNQIETDAVWDYIVEQVKNVQITNGKFQSPVCFSNANFPIALAGEKSVSNHDVVSFGQNISFKQPKQAITLISTTRKEIKVDIEVTNTGLKPWEEGCYLEFLDTIGSNNPSHEPVKRINLPPLKPTETSQLTLTLPIIQSPFTGITEWQWIAKTENGELFALSERLTVSATLCIGSPYGVQTTGQELAHILKMSDGTVQFSQNDFQVIDSDLHVTGNATINYQTVVAQDIRVEGNIQISSPTIIRHNVRVEGNIQINAPVYIGRDIRVEGNFFIDAPVHIGRDVRIEGNCYWGNSISIGRNISVEGTMYYSHVFFNGKTHIKGSDNVYKNYATIDTIAAEEKLRQMPIGKVAPVGALPLMSRMIVAQDEGLIIRQSELTQIAEVFGESINSSDPTSTKQIALVGASGIGKSSIAADFAHRYGRFFLGGVFWLNFSNPDSIPFEIIRCGGQEGLAIPGFELLDYEQQLNRMRDEWETAVPRLLIADDCNSAELITQWLPQTGGCHVLITTRNESLAKELNLPAINVSKLTLEECNQLVVGHAPHLKRADVDLITKAVGRHPQFLVLAGKYLNTVQDRVSVEKYVENLGTYLDDASSTLERKEAHQTAVLNISWNLLASDEVEYHNSRIVLQQLSQFNAYTIIQADLLQKALAANEQFLPASNEADQTTQALNLLLQLGMIDSFDQNRDAIRVPPHVAAFVRQQETAVSTAQKALEETIINEITAKQLLDGVRFSQIRPWRDHFQSVTDRAIERIDSIANSLCAAYTEYLMHEGIFNAAIPYAQRELEIKQALPDIPQADLAIANERLGRLYHQLGHLDTAQDYFEATYRINQAAMGAKHRYTIQALNNLAAIYNERGHYHEALPLHQQTLKLREETLGENHPDTAESLNNLAATYRALGDFDAALPMYKRALKIQRAIVGDNHPDTATACHNLGIIYEETAQYDLALTNYEKALALREQWLGSTHLDTADTLERLANVDKDIGRYSEARRLFDRVLGIRETMLGDEHPQTAACINDIGELLLEQGDYDQAKTHFERALAIREKVLGFDHPDVAQSLNNLGALLSFQDNYESARKYFERALKINEEQLGTEHPAVAQILNNLGYLLRSLDDYEGAQAYYQRALAIRESAFGSNHPTTAQSLNNLGVLAKAQDDLATAESYFRRALTIYQNIFGLEHPTTANCLNNLGSLCQKQGNYVQAEAYFTQALTIREKMLGTQHVDTIDSRRRLDRIKNLQTPIPTSRGTLESFEHGYALIIGVDDNQVTRLALPTVAKDVRAIHDVLIHPGRCAYKAENVRLLMGQEATKSNILEGFLWLNEKVKADPEATAFIYYSGHGYHHKKTEEYYLIPYNFQSAARVRTDALPAKFIAAVIAEIQSPRTLVLLDCCHQEEIQVLDLDLDFDPYLTSMAFPHATSIVETLPAYGYEPGSKDVGDLNDGNGRAVLISSTGAESSYVRSDQKMSVFAYHLVEALTGHAPHDEDSTVVYVTDVMSWVYRRVKETAAAMNVSQTPVMHTSNVFPVAQLIGGEGVAKGVDGRPAPPDPLAPLPGVAVNVQGDDAVVATGDNATINKAEGANISGSVNTGGDFAGRDLNKHEGGFSFGEGSQVQFSGPAIAGDQNIAGDNVQGNKYGGDHVEGDKFSGDKVMGDKVGGDQISVGNISGSSGIAIGRGASANVSTTSYGTGREVDFGQLFAPLQTIVAQNAPALIGDVNALKAEVQRGASANDEVMADLIDSIATAVPAAKPIIQQIFANSAIAESLGSITKFMLKRL